EDLRTRAQAEIDLELRNQKVIDMHPHQARRFLPVLFVILAINIVLAITTDKYTLVWIVSSFWLYMYFFIVIMLPTTRRVRSPSEGAQGKKKAPYRFAGIRDVLRKGKKAVIITFWNSFFVGTQTMARGIWVMLVISFVFAIFGWLVFNAIPGAAVAIVLAQGAAIIGYYLFIMRYRPYSKEFISNLSNVRRERKVRWDTYLKGAVAVILLVTVFSILIVTAMFLPKTSLDAVIAYLESSGFQIDLLDLIVIFTSQFILVRYIQGFDSAKFASAFIRDKIEFLRNDILAGLDSLNGLADDERTTRFQSIKDRFFASKIYMIAYKNFFGYLPSYPLIVDFRSVLEEDVIEAMGEDIPLDITV
ncbi:MAG: hypothetical protein ISF22_05800, partial [Methanomassiliicoccus sp.]|nr:hypothetical protein [Methanomassiliicoccus sp.]